MKKQKFLVWILVLVLVMAMFSSCGGEAQDDSSYTGGDFYNKTETDFGFAADGSYVPDKSETENGTGKPTTFDEKIIKTVHMVAETREFDKAFAEIRTAVSAVGGYEESVRNEGKSYHAGDYYSRSAYLVVRIPSGELDAFLGRIGGMVNVTSENATVSNVTTEYYDVQSRIAVLENEKQAYEEMLKKSDDVNYLLQIRERLYDVIEEIEAYKTRLSLLDSKVAYSTVSITLDEVIEYTPKIVKEPTFGERVGKAFTESWKDFADGCQDFAVWFIGAIPTLLVVAVIVGGAVALLIYSNQRARARANKRKQNAEQNHEK